MTTTSAAVSQTQSLAAIRNLVRVAVSCIAFARGLCDDSSFEQRSFLGIQLKHLLPSTPEAVTISKWIEHGAFDALNRGYLKEMSLCVYNPQCSELLESYSFAFAYTHDGRRARMVLSTLQNADASSVAMGKGNGEECSKEAVTTRCRRRTKQEVRLMLVNLLTKLVMVVDSLPPLLSERVLTMRLTYYDEITPSVYEPPCYAPASNHMVQMYDEEQQYNVSVGSMDTSHHMLTVAVRHPLLSKVQSQLEHERTRQKTSNSSLVGGTAHCQSTLSAVTADGMAGTAHALTSHAGEKSVPDVPKLKAGEAGSVLYVGDVHTFPSLDRLVTAAPPLRSCVTAYLVLATFAFISCSFTGGGRGRLSLHELRDYLRVSCPLDISWAAAVAVLDRLTVEGYLQRVPKSGSKRSRADIQNACSTPSAAQGIDDSSKGTSAPEWGGVQGQPSLNVLSALVTQREVMVLLPLSHRDALQKIKDGKGAPQNGTRRRKTRVWRRAQDAA